MTNFLNLPTAEQFDVHNSLLASIASNNGGIKINNWEDLQRINRMRLIVTGKQIGRAHV